MNRVRKGGFIVQNGKDLKKHSRRIVNVAEPIQDPAGISRSARVTFTANSFPDIESATYSYL